MSIMNCVAAASDEKRKNEWLAKLEQARDTKDWSLVDALIQELREFSFEE
jgi:hypothetical protein